MVEIGSEVSVNDLWIHDEKDIYKAHALVRMFDDPHTENHLPRPFGVFYDVERPTYEDVLAQQIADAQNQHKEMMLDDLLRGKQTWEIRNEEPVLV